MKLSYDSTISRHLVHRSSVAEVLLTDWRQTAVDRFELAAQWPREHSLFRTRDGHFDPLLAAETIRQAGILLAHVGYNVPHGRPFLMQRLAFECDPKYLHWKRAPLNVLVKVSVSEVLRRGSTVGGMRIDVTLLRDDERRIGSGSGWLRCVTPTAYRRVRWVSQPSEPREPPAVTPADPVAVGRHLPSDVVVGPPDATGSCPLRVSLDHPVFFDHPLDHVPGMLAIEAMRQAALLRLDRPRAVMVAADATFPKFLDIDRPCLVMPAQVCPAPGLDAVDVRCVQDGLVAVQGRVTLSR